MKPCIRYCEGYKYQLEQTYACRIAIRPMVVIETDWLKLDETGVLTIRKGYAWDGPSGPAFDTPSFMRASLVHDALYQLMRMGLLDVDMREPADEQMRVICIEDGMLRIRAWWCHRGVRLGAGPAADPANSTPVRCAPDSECCHT